MSYNIQYENIKFYYNNLMLGMIITDKVFKYCHFGDFLYSIEVGNDIINRHNSVFNYSDFECRVMFISELTLYSGILYENFTITKYSISYLYERSSYFPKLSNYYCLL